MKLGLLLLLCIAVVQSTYFTHFLYHDIEPVTLKLEKTSISSPSYFERDVPIEIDKWLNPEFGIKVVAPTDIYRYSVTYNATGHPECQPIGKCKVVFSADVSIPDQVPIEKWHRKYMVSSTRRYGVKLYASTGIFMAPMTAVAWVLDGLQGSYLNNPSQHHSLLFKDDNQGVIVYDIVIQNHSHHDVYLEDPKGSVECKAPVPKVVRSFQEINVVCMGPENNAWMSVGASLPDVIEPQRYPDLLLKMQKTYNQGVTAFFSNYREVDKSLSITLEVNEDMDYNNIVFKISDPL
ncbi:hypothetical protein P9112_000264 [Eukaryota sp. TZLM1-RC]